MQKFLLSFACLLASVLVTSAQTSTPTPKPAPDEDVVKISTNLIQIDVSVMDKNGKAVTDLRPDELEVYENGERQKITNFSFVSAQRNIQQREAKPTGNVAVPAPTQTLRPEQIRRTIALVVDDISLSFESAAQVRRGLKKFVDEQMQPGDLVAIIRTGAGIGALQQFTSEKRLLYAAIEKVKYNAAGNGGISAFAPIGAQVDSEDQTLTLDDEGTVAGSGQTLDDFREQAFVTGTLGALRYIVTGMSGLPGRKAVILFSDGFSIYEGGSDGGQTLSRVADFLTQLVDLANRNSVVFYTVDARGLQTAGFTALDSPSDTTGAGLANAQRSRTQLLRDTQEGLTTLAEETGGFAILNNNDLSGGVRRVLEDQSYYLVGYEPDSDTFDAAKRKFNRLEVKVRRPGVTVRYRSGFFNVAEDRRPQTPFKEQTPIAQLETALVSPFNVSGIDLRMNALFGSDAKNGAYVRSLLHVNAGDLKFTDEKDGTKQAIFDVLAMSFGDNGQIVDRLAKTYTLKLKPDAYSRILANGFVYRFVFPVKKAGAFQYRVALRDTQGGHVGSASQFIEVPDLKKGRLTVSSIVLENLSEDQWRNISLTGASVGSDPVADTALRRVKLGSVLRYGYEVYNAKLDGSKRPQLTTRIRVFRGGELVLDGKQTLFDPGSQNDLLHLRVGGAVRIGDKLVAGDYILQVIVTDQAAKARIATQFVQFEVVP